MIDNIRPGELRPFGKNSRTHSVEQVTQIANSIKKFGFTNPVLTDGSYGIIAGHGRVLAAIELGMETVPTIALSHLSKKQIRAYVIADNKLALNAGWDDAILKEELTGILESGIDLDLTGFSLDEIDDLLGTESEPSEKDDDVPEVEQNVHNVQLGDLWQLGEHRLLCGDSTDKVQVDRLMDGQKADMVFTDPPYGMNLDTDYKNMFQSDSISLGRRTNFDSVKGDNENYDPKHIIEVFDCDLFIWGCDYFYDKLPKGGCFLAWDKRTDELDKVPGNSTEFCWSNSPRKRISFRILWSGHLGMLKDGTKKRVHPTQKPVALAESFFDKWGKDKNLIVDLFLGSGSTLIACEKTNRKCYGMEIDPHYCSVIIERWQKFTESKAELL